MFIKFASFSLQVAQIVLIALRIQSGCLVLEINDEMMQGLICEQPHWTSARSHYMPAPTVFVSVIHSLHLSSLLNLVVKYYMVFFTESLQLHEALKES